MYNKNTFLKITALMYKQEHISEKYSYMKVKQAALWSTNLPITQNAQTWGNHQIMPWTGWKVRPVPGTKYWSGLSFALPGDLPDPGMELVSPALAGLFSSTAVTWEAP